jgi:hypothetical protein
MKKLCLLTAVLLVLSAWVVAQDTQAGGSSSPQSSSDQANSSQSSSNTSQTTIEGCLAGSSGSYTLSDNSGKTYQLRGDTSKLSDHVGHQVRLKGSETGASASATTSSGASATANTGSSGSNPPSSSASPSGASSPSGSASAAIQFDVKSVKHVSEHCTTPSSTK